VGAFALPESFTLIVGFLGSFDAILNVALFFPPDVGPKVIVTAHELPAAIVVQWFVWLKSEGLLPEMVIELMTRSALPLFLMVTPLSEVPPGFRLPQLTDIGLTDILGRLVVASKFSDEPAAGNGWGHALTQVLKERNSDKPA
jgi:hypothetical protein